MKLDQLCISNAFPLESTFDYMSTISMLPSLLKSIKINVNSMPMMANDNLTIFIEAIKVNAILYFIFFFFLSISFRDENSHVVLKFFDEEKRVRELAFGRDYQLKAEVNQPNGTYGIKVKNCFAFNRKNFSMPLIDDRGCSINGVIMSRFMPSADGQSATSMIYSMFKFPEGAEIQIQCDIIQCNGKCADDEKCGEDSSSFVKGGRALGQTEEGLLLAATTVFVLDPSEVRAAPLCDNTGIRPHWLLWLAIVLGVLFLIMLLMNLFLCTAMSCSCARTEVSFFNIFNQQTCFISFFIRRLLKKNLQLSKNTILIDHGTGRNTAQDIRCTTEME